MYVAHLTLHDFRSYADVDVALEPGATAFIGRNGQGKTNLVEAIDYLSRLVLAPGRHRRAAGPGRRRPGGRPGGGRPGRAHGGARGRDQPGPGQPGPGQPVAAAPGPRALGLVRTVVFSPEDLALVKGDPSRPAPVPRRPAGAAHPAAGRRARRLRPGAQAAQLAAQDRRRRAPRVVLAGGGARRRSGLGRPPGPGRRRAARPRGCALVDDLRPYVGKAYETVARGRVPRRRRRSTTSRRFELGGRHRPRPDARPRRCSPRLERRRDDELDRGHLAWSARTATSCCSPSATASCGCRSRATPRHGESWSFALALRLASYDLLRADGDDPILILDDVFAELDTERREQLAELVAGAEQVLVTAAVRRRRAGGAAGRAVTWSRDGEVTP